MIIIDLPIFESVRSSQLQHGLKYEDYQQYRSYCSRRLHRLRRSLNVAQGIPPSAKARHQRGRKLMDVSNAMVLEVGEKDVNFAERMLLIPLCLAERAWAYATDLKQSVLEHPRKRFHAIRRFEKAAQHATRFEKLVVDPESPCSERTKQEAIAYAAHMNGLYKFECENWAEAKEALKKSMTIYFTLCLFISKDAILEQYRQRIDEIRATLRYCAFNLGEKDKAFATPLPSTLQFHDIAFKHFERLQDEAISKASAAAAAAAAIPGQVKSDDVEMQGVKSETVNDQDSEDEEENFSTGDEGEDDDFDQNNEQPQQSEGIWSKFFGRK